LTGNNFVVYYLIQLNIKSVEWSHDSRADSQNRVRKFNR